MFYIRYCAGNNNCKNPPVLDSNLKPNERYTEELKTWCLVTDLPKQKQCVTIALSLPESDASGKWDIVVNEISFFTREMIQTAGGAHELS